MINYIADIYLCGLTVLGEIALVFISAMLIQLISYQCFGINLYQILNKGLNRLDKYLTKVF